MGITHKWNGTILTITSDSGTSSADLKGAKGDRGIRGAQGATGLTIGADGIIDTSKFATKEYVDNEIIAGAGGLSNESKALLVAILRSAVFDTNQAPNITALEQALFENSGDSDINILISISATYIGGAVPVGTSLNSLTGLVVTGLYSDGSTKEITDYTLSGTIQEGANTILVNYEGKATTFTVIGIDESNGYTLIRSWDFTKSMVDTVSGVTAESNIEMSSSGITFAASNYSNGGTDINQPYIRLLQNTSFLNKAIEIDIPSALLQQPTTQHARLFGIGLQDYRTNTDAAAFVWRYNTSIGWASYAGNTSGGGWDSTINNATYPITFFNKKTLRLECDSSGYITAYYAELGSKNFTEINKWSIPWQITDGNFIIGGYSDNFICPITFSGVRIYQKEG